MIRYMAAQKEILKGLSENNPALNVKPALKPMRHSHFAALEAKDLPEFIKNLERNEARLYPQTLGYAGQMTGHGFRALAMSTIKEKLGYRHEVVDRQLAHAPQGKINQAYDRAAFLPERKKMMQEWSDYIDSVAVSGKIIELDKKKA